MNKSILTILMLAIFFPLQAQEIRNVPILGEYPVEQTHEDSAFIPRMLLISNNKQLTDVWKKLKGGDLPIIDFKSSIVVASVRDAADPNQRRFLPRVRMGELEINILSTRIGFQPSTRTVTTLIEVSREGIRSFRQYDPKTRKYLITKLK